MHLLAYLEDPPTSEAAFNVIERLASRFTVFADLILVSNVKRRQLGRLPEANVRTLQLTGPTEQFIAEAFRLRRYDLVVIAAEERRGLIRLVRGSRVGPLMHQTPSSVLLVRGPEPKFEHLLVGVSASPYSQHDVRLAGILAKAFGARVTLAHVVSQIPLVYTSLRQQQREIELQGFLQSNDAAAVQMQRAHDLLAEMGIVAKLVLREGLVSEQLIDLCRRPGRDLPPVDLLVIGAHERMPGTGIDYYDDIAEQIAVSAPLSTLIVHAESDWSAWESK